MAVIQLPSTLKLKSLVVGQRRHDLDFSNPESGNGSVRPLGPPQWTYSFTSDDQMDLLQASEWEALQMQMRGRINRLEAWDVGKPAPLGTMRGTMTLNGAHAAGAVTLNISAAGQGSKTLLQGDWLRVASGLGTSQLVKVLGAATADVSGNIAVTVEPPLRLAFTSGTAVSWDKPTAFYQLESADASWKYERAIQGSFSLTLVEKWY